MQMIGKQYAFRTAITGVTLLLGTGVAHANRYGELHVTGRTTLTDDQYGSIVIEGNNASLDCKNHMVHISQYTQPNCNTSSFQPPNLSKCAIVAQNITNLVIQNCRIVGAFDVGLLVYGSNAIALKNVSSAGPTFGFELFHNVSTTGTGLTASQNWDGFTIDTDTYGIYSYLTAEASQTIGLLTTAVRHSSFANMSFTGSGQTGLYSYGDLDTYFDEVDVSGAGQDGIVVDSGDHVHLRNAISTGNARGLNVDSTKNSELSGGQFFGNSSGCDATQTRSTSNAWLGNYIEHACGDVPTPH